MPDLSNSRYAGQTIDWTAVTGVDILATYYENTVKDTYTRNATVADLLALKAEYKNE